MMRRPLLRYALMQIPGLALFTAALFVAGHWISIPWRLLVLLVAVWIAKDAAMYPFVRHGYAKDESGRSGMIGRRGTVKERLAPSGHIELDGVLWRAVIQPGNCPLETGARVQVKDVRDLTLIVESVREGK